MRSGRWILGVALAACGGAAPPPPVAAPKEESRGTPEEYAAAQDFFTRKRAAVFTCYQNAVENRELKESQEGKVKLGLAITTTGTTEGVHVVDSTLKSKAVEDCVVAMVGKWQLPAPAHRFDFLYNYDFKAQ